MNNPDIKSFIKKHNSLFWYVPEKNKTDISYLVGVFVRKKKNKSGTVSVQVIDKSSGSYRHTHPNCSNPAFSSTAGLLTKQQ